MNKKTKLILLGIVLLVLITIGATYAYWLITKTQTKENTLTAACLDISLTNEKNDIVLTEQYPMSDEAGLELTPFSFTVTNNCDSETEFVLDLESTTTDTNKMSSSSVKVALNKNAPKLLSKYIVTTPTIEGAYESHTIDFGVLAAKEVKNYELRLWIDEKAPFSENNTSFKSKVSVSVGENVSSTINATLATNYGLEVGDYVNYTFDVAEPYLLKQEYSGYTEDQNVAQVDMTHWWDSVHYNWRVLNVDANGNVELFLTYDAPVVNPFTPSKVYFGGVEGYSNAAYLLDDMTAKLYSNTELNIKARNLTMDDITRQISEEGFAARDSYDEYEFEKTYVADKVDATDGIAYNYYPKIEELYPNASDTDKLFSSESELVTKDNGYVRTTENLTIKHTYWGESSWKTQESYFINPEVYEMFRPEGNKTVAYWTGSRWRYNVDDYAIYGLYVLGRGFGLDGVTRYTTDGGSKYTNVYIYPGPIVTIPSDVEIVTNSEPNSITNKWELSKKSI